MKEWTDDYEGTNGDGHEGVNGMKEWMDDHEGTYEWAWKSE